MSISVSARFEFEDASGNTLNMTLRNCKDPDDETSPLTDAALQALSAGIVTNGSIFENVPIANTAIEVVKTERTEVDVE